jgi:hypothetical protein
MKNKKFLLVSLVALLAILLSACAGAVTETSAQPADAQNVNAPAAPGVEASLRNTNFQQNTQNGQGGRGERDLTAAAEALGVTVEELQAALQASIHADCTNLTDQDMQPGNREGCRPDLTVAAETLGVTVEELKAALGAGEQGGRGERDLTAAAEALGITVEELEQAIADAKPAECVDGERPEGVDCRPDVEALAESLGVTVEELEAVIGRRGGPDFAAAAETLGVTEEELQQALQAAKPAECATAEEGAPKDPNCRPDIEAAAETLGVTTEELQQALGKPEGGHGGPGETHK